jgi:hypothetical protein
MTCGWWYVQLMPLSEVLMRMHAGEFKRNCALGTSRPILHAGMIPTYVSQSPYRFYGTPRVLDARE